MKDELRKAFKPYSNKGLITTADFRLVMTKQGLTAEEIDEFIREISEDGGDLEVEAAIDWLCENDSFGLTSHTG